jgi:arylsulfatase A-like enzyme
MILDCSQVVTMQASPGRSPGARIQLGVTAVVLFSLMTSLLACAPPPPRSAILIIVDTLRADHLGVYGSRRPTSPFLDELAKRGRVFENAFATSPWTLPSIGSMLTGLTPSGHSAGTLVNRSPAGYWKRSRIGPHGFVKLDSGVSTVPEQLAERGIATLAVMQNPNLNPAFALSRGFEVYDFQSGTNFHIRRADVVVERALAHVEAYRDRRFFLVVHFFDPHFNYDPAAPVRGRFTREIDADMQLPVAGIRELRHGHHRLTEAQKTFIQAAYDEEIAVVDTEIRNLVDGLRSLGVWKQSLVVFVSDHGEEFFEHGGFEHGHSVFNEVVRVPLIVWGPGVEPGRDATPVSIADIAPTLLEAFRISPGQALYGQSLWPCLSGQDAASAPRMLLAEGTLYGEEQKMAIRWPYKVVVKDGAPTPRLFDLEEDPLERTDVRDSRPDVAASLERELEDTVRRAALGARHEEAELDPETIDELRSLGYVE